MQVFFSLDYSALKTGGTGYPDAKTPGIGNLLDSQ
jgi:hypothetical protein